MEVRTTRRYHGVSQWGHNSFGIRPHRPRYGRCCSYLFEEEISPCVITDVVVVVRAV